MGQAGRAVEYSCHAGDGGEAVCPESFAVGVTTPLTCCCQGRLAVMEAPRQPRWRGSAPEWAIGLWLGVPPSPELTGWGNSGGSLAGSALPNLRVDDVILITLCEEVGSAGWGERG